MAKRNNTLLYVGIGAAAAVAGYFVWKSRFATPVAPPDRSDSSLPPSSSSNSTTSSSPSLPAATLSDPAELYLMRGKKYLVDTEFTPSALPDVHAWISGWSKDGNAVDVLKNAQGQVVGMTVEVTATVSVYAHYPEAHTTPAGAQYTILSIRKV